MDDYSDDQPFWEVAAGRPLVVMPYALDTNDMKFWTDPALSTADWLRYAIDTFDWLYEEGASRAADDVARRASPDHRSAGAHRRVRAFPEACDDAARCLDRDAGVDRRSFRGASPAARSKEHE